MFLISGNFVRELKNVLQGDVQAGSQSFNMGGNTCNATLSFGVLKCFKKCWKTFKSS